VSDGETRAFRARLDEGPAVAAFVEAAAAGLEPALRMRLALAVEELFVNTVTHGHGGGADAPVEVTVTRAGGRLVLTYRDSAPPFDPFAAVAPPDPDASVDARPVGGLGVFLMTALAERCAYARTGDRNCITVELRMPA
jgi:serine/threonine-protein kinase RsbW